MPQQADRSQEPDTLRYASLEDIDAAMKRHAELQQQIDRRLATHKRRVKADKARMDVQNKPKLAEQKRIEAAAAKYLKANRRQLIDRYGKVIKRPRGVVAFRVIGRHLSGPDKSPRLVNFLLKRRGGTRYLTFTPSLNRDAIAQSQSRLLKLQLAPFGFRIGRTERLTIKPVGYDEPVLLDERPYAHVK